MLCTVLTMTVLVMILQILTDKLKNGGRLVIPVGEYRPVSTDSRIKVSVCSCTLLSHCEGLRRICASMQASSMMSRCETSPVWCHTCSAKCRPQRPIKDYRAMQHNGSIRAGTCYAGTEVHRQGQGRQHHREGPHGSPLCAAQGRNSFPEQRRVIADLSG